MVEVGSSRLLFDLGTGTIRRLLEAGVTISDITHVFLSHLHPDHTGEFVSFLFATKYPEVYPRRDPFFVAGGRGVRWFYRTLKKVYGSWIVLDPGMMNMIEFDGGKEDMRAFDDFAVHTLPLAHIDSSVGFRVVYEGISVVYTGDTDMCENLVSLARNADLLICEAAMPDERKVAGHLTPSLAGDVAARAKVNHLVLTHFYPDCDGVDIAAECRKTYNGPLTLARDLMRIEVTRSCVAIKEADTV